MKLTRDFSEDLEAVRTALGCDFAIISHIKKNDYEVAAVNSELTNVQLGAHFQIQDTYCNAVIKTRNTVTYDKVGSIKAMILHPIYTAMQLEAYIGEPIRAKGDIIGTLNFSGFKPKKPPFNDKDVRLVKALAKEIEAAIDPDSI